MTTKQEVADAVTKEVTKQLQVAVKPKVLNLGKKLGLDGGKGYNLGDQLVHKVVRLSYEELANTLPGNFSLPDDLPLNDFLGNDGDYLIAWVTGNIQKQLGLLR